jgi:hypothetical protein
MSALHYNLRIQQGATYRKVFRWLDAAGNLKPIGNWTGHAQIKTAYGITNSLLNLSTQTGEILLLDGYITLFLTKAQTRSLPVVYKSPGPANSTYFYDLFLYDEYSYGRRIFYGNVLVIGALTDEP